MKFTTWRSHVSGCHVALGNNKGEIQNTALVADKYEDDMSKGVAAGIVLKGLGKLQFVGISERKMMLHAWGKKIP